MVANLAPMLLANFVTIHQDAGKVGTVDIIDSVTGKVIKNAEPKFQSDSLIFSWPYAEMTSNLLNKDVYAVIFPDNSNNSILYRLNSQLETVQMWTSTPYWFFDLQYLPKQQSLYGIKVVSTYGRVFSRFQQDTSNSDALQAAELFTLPYMWYVNASTASNTENRYFALLNYFPGHPESTLDQKLLIAQLDPDSNAQTFSVVDIQPMINGGESIGIIHFLSYSHSTRSIWALSMNDQHRASLASIDASSEQIQGMTTLVTVDYVDEIGPLVVDDDQKMATFFIKSKSVSSSHPLRSSSSACPSSSWQLVQVSLQQAEKQQAPKMLQCFDEAQYAIFAAAAKF